MPEDDLMTCLSPRPPRPAIVVLLMSMVNERQPFVLRCAVLYCFQCFLYRNQKGQGEIVATLLPSTIDGQFLCQPGLPCSHPMGSITGRLGQIYKYCSMLSWGFLLFKWLYHICLLPSKKHC